MSRYQISPVPLQEKGRPLSELSCDSALVKLRVAIASNGSVKLNEGEIQY
jgi:hypothetical protein